MKGKVEAGIVRKKRKDKVETGKVGKRGNVRKKRKGKLETGKVGKRGNVRKKRKGKEGEER